MPLEAAIGRVFTPYRPGGRHGHRFWLFEASIQKAQNGPSTQLIEATSCVESSNAMNKAKEQC